MTIDQAVVDTADFLQPLMPDGTQIIRGMANNVPPPWGVNFISITEVGQPQYTTTRVKLDSITGKSTYEMPKKLNLQLDFFGDDSGDMCSTAVTMLRSMYATEKFASGFEPLFCTDAMQAPFMTGEKQFQTRWLCTFSLQYNPTVTVNEESFANVGDVISNPVDITTPAE